jgi:PAS domain S-box-containing protein
VLRFNKKNPSPKERALRPAGRQRLKHEHRVLVLALAAGLPGVLVSLVLLWTGDYTAKVEWTLTTLIISFWLGCALALQGRVIWPLQTLSNLLAALREGDFSIRARGATRDDVLGDVLLEVNELGETLRTQRLGALEATALLRTVMTEIDVAVFAFDREERLVLINRAGERLMAQHAERLMGRSARELNLDDCLHMEDEARTLQMSFPGEAGRWEVRRSTFRTRGEPHHLLVLSNLSRALREEERQAWQRLVRVLGHELNNSLAPIKSIAGSLENLLIRRPQPPDWDEDMRRGLSVINARAGALSRFMSAYARLARLPQPRFEPVDVALLIRRAVKLETRLDILLVPGPELMIEADADQLEQVLINLLRNAVDAAMETGGGVRMGWQKANAHLDIWIEDEGPGLANTTNLFVPFFTTKPEGSGIGLALSQQIAEAHGGAITLENRRAGQGCEARLRLPL